METRIGYVGDIALELPCNAVQELSYEDKKVINKWWKNKEVQEQLKKYSIEELRYAVEEFNPVQTRINTLKRETLEKRIVYYASCDIVDAEKFEALYS